MSDFIYNFIETSFGLISMSACKISYQHFTIISFSLLHAVQSLFACEWILCSFVFIFFPSLIVRKIVYRFTLSTNFRHIHLLLKCICIVNHNHISLVLRSYSSINLCFLFASFNNCCSMHSMRSYIIQWRLQLYFNSQRSFFLTLSSLLIHKNAQCWKLWKKCKLFWATALDFLLLYASKLGIIPLTNVKPCVNESN